jgi:hypothetical protein
MVRDGDVPTDGLVVIRAVPSDQHRLLRNIVDDAQDSAETYVVLRPDGQREILYGISVFALRPGQRASETMTRFRTSSHLLQATVGTVREAGFELWPTGSNPDHYDLQLLPGRIEGVSKEAGTEEIRAVAARLLWATDDPEPNPGYAGDPEGDGP